MTTPPSEREPWACVAYGKELTAALGTGPICFFPDASCRTDDECETRMGEERKRVYRRMQELSTTDPLWAHVADGFATPGTLLGGEDDPCEPTGP